MMSAMSRAIWVASLIALAACGKKNEEAATSGSSGPVQPAPTAAPPAPALPPGDATAEVPADAMAAPTADAAVATVDPCSFATREEIEKITAGWTKDPEPVAVTASVLGGCSFELANRYVTIDARPLAELATLVPQHVKSAKERGFPPKTTATSNAETGDTYVTFEDKPYILHVHADAGEGNPDVKLASRLAALLAKGAK